MSHYVLEKSLGDHEHGRALLYSSGASFLVASYSKAFIRPEVLVFKSDPEGNVTDWIELFGEKHDKEITINEAIHSTMARFNKLDNGHNK